MLEPKRHVAYGLPTSDYLNSMPALALCYLIWRIDEATLLLIVGALIAKTRNVDGTYSGTTLDRKCLRTASNIPLAAPTGRALQ